MHQFNKGWKEWSEASSELKAMGHEVPPTNVRQSALHLSENNSSQTTGSRSTEPLERSRAEAPPSVTEATTRHLDSAERK
jgi:hypothetical protein